MNEPIKQFAHTAGFYLAEDGNFYGEDNWCNPHIVKLAQAVADDCVKILAKIALENADNDDQVWIASKTINQITQRYGLK